MYRFFIDILYFFFQVGQDEFGYMLSEILKENNVDNSGVRFDPGARTALAFVTLRADGEREFMFFRNPSADMLLLESELNIDIIKKVKMPLLITVSNKLPCTTNSSLDVFCTLSCQGCIFHYGSISLIEEPCRSTHLAAMDIAKESGSILSYDPNLRLPLWPSADAARKGIMSIWNKADIIKAGLASSTVIFSRMYRYFNRI